MKYLIIALIAISSAYPLWGQHCGSCDDSNKVTLASNTNPASQVLKEGRKHSINNDYYLVYSWQKKPKIGMAVLMVDIFRSKDNKRSDDFKVTANAYMPSMRGSHDTGDRQMKLNKNKRHLIDVNFMMLGDWEIELKVAKNSRELFKGLVQTKI